MDDDHSYVIRVWGVDERGEWWHAKFEMPHSVWRRVESQWSYLLIAVAHLQHVMGDTPVPVRALRWESGCPIVWQHSAPLT